MCGRFNIIDDPLTQLLISITGQGQGWSLKTQFNVAPTQDVPVLVLGEDGVWQQKEMRWWLVPSWSDGPGTKYSMFNAKSETLEKSRAYRGPFKRQRCIVPVSGYYEWQKQGDRKQPYYIEPADAPGFALAGLWDRWERDGQTVESCTIVTAAAPKALSFVHHRIPVHFTDEQANLWAASDSAADALKQLLVPEIRLNIDVTPMSTYVNNARNKGEACLEKIGETKTIH